MLVSKYILGKSNIKLSIKVTIRQFAIQNYCIKKPHRYNHKQLTYNYNMKTYQVQIQSQRQVQTDGKSRSNYIKPLKNCTYLSKLHKCMS